MLALGGVLLGISGASAATYYLMTQGERDTHAVWHDIVVPIKNAGCGVNQEGSWTGDITELYRLGIISRDVAEADIAPLKPLVDKPRPYHGYFVVAMDSGPGDDGWTPVSVKGNLRSSSWGVCVFPATADRPDLPVILICSGGIHTRASEGNKPILSWPKERSGWAIAR